MYYHCYMSCYIQINQIHNVAETIAVRVYWEVLQSNLLAKGSCGSKPGAHMYRSLSA